MIDIIPTVVPHDATELVKAMHTASAFSRYLHVDIDDGLFAPSLTWPYVGVDMYSAEALSLSRPVVVEAHLMVQHPQGIGLDLIRSGVRTLIAHIESCADASNAEQLLAQWRSVGAEKVGLAIVLDTPLEQIMPCIPHCDMVQVMSVAKIGEQGAPFDERAIERVAAIHTAYPDAVIAVDGGVSSGNIITLKAAGATQFAVGSAIMQTVDPAAAYALLKNLVA